MDGTVGLLDCCSKLRGVHDLSKVVTARKESNVGVPAGVLIGVPKRNSEVEI